ncbi:MAG: tetratricopeptide repeat protein [Chloroflexota bacterium]
MNDRMSAQSVKEEGLRLFEEGLYPEAAERFEQAREAFVAEGDLVEAAEMLNNLGIVYRMRHEWDNAVEALEGARSAFAALDDRSREAQVLGNLGGLYASQSDREEARACLRQAANIFGELGDNQRRGETMLALGVQLWKAGDRQGGLAAYQAGLQMLEHPSLSQRVLRGLLEFRARLLGWGF